MVSPLFCWWRYAKRTTRMAWCRWFSWPGPLRPACRTACHAGQRSFVFLQVTHNTILSLLFAPSAPLVRWSPPSGRLDVYIRLLFAYGQDRKRSQRSHAPNATPPPSNAIPNAMPVQVRCVPETKVWRPRPDWPTPRHGGLRRLSGRLPDFHTDCHSVIGEPLPGVTLQGTLAHI